MKVLFSSFPDDSQSERLDLWPKKENDSFHESADFPARSACARQASFTALLGLAGLNMFTF